MHVENYLLHKFVSNGNISPFISRFPCDCSTSLYLSIASTNSNSKPSVVAHKVRALIAIWAPIILVYFTDAQIWYAIFSTLFGGVLGAFRHVGEIRTLEMLRSRFQKVPSAFGQRFLPSAHHDSKTKLSIPAALSIAKDFKWKEYAELIKLIKGDSYMHSAVIECYEMIKCLIDSLLEDEANKKIVMKIYDELANSRREEKFLKEFKMSGMPLLSVKLEKWLNILVAIELNLCSLLLCFSSALFFLV
ncbi:hypothetical protein CRYUN_Cryun15aG0045600 [Craigia yunnanensis]